MSFGTEQGEVLIPTISPDGRRLSDDQAIEMYRRTGRHLGIFRTPDEATAFAQGLSRRQERQYVRPDRRQSRPRRVATASPVSDGRAVVLSLFPNARITSNYRGPNHPLTRRNPRSWHAQSRAAVDVAPIRGMTFQQYIQRFRDAGYEILEQRDEVNNPSSHATGPHWHVVLGRRR